MANIFDDRLKIKKGHVTAHLTLIGFSEDDQFILYSPAMDLYSFGDNETEAIEALDEVMFLYFNYVIEENTVDKELKRLGWKKHSYFKSKFLPPKYDPREIMSKKGVDSFNVMGKEMDLQPA